MPSGSRLTFISKKHATLFWVCAMLFHPLFQNNALAADAFTQTYQAAQDGEARSQFELGTYYFKIREMDKAGKWLTDAAKQGLGEANLNLGYMYDKGLGLPRNDYEALKYYKKAAEQKVPQAYINIGLLYERGEGVKENPTEAAKWFQKAVDANLPEGRYRLGLAYMKGHGIEQNYDQAWALFQKAEVQKNCDSLYAMAYMTAHGMGVSADILQAQNKILEAAACGSAQAQYDAVFSYIQEKHHRLTNKQALAQLEAAAKTAPQAQALLGAVYFTGQLEAQKDFAKALAWAKLAEENKAKGVKPLLQTINRRINIMGERRAKHREALKILEEIRLETSAYDGTLLIKGHL
jgi:TPR repeat protein